MSKNALKRARFAAANARIERPAASTHYVHTVKHATVARGATLLGNFERGRARQAHEADQRDALALGRVVETKLPAPGDHVAHAEYVALVAVKYGVAHDNA